MLADALNRTLLLMGTELNPECSLDLRLHALTSTRVLIVADAAVVAGHAGQTALVTAATLMARSGHEVWIDAPEAELAGPQPPLQGEHLLEALFDLGRDLLPGQAFRRGRPSGTVDLAVLLGTPEWAGDARQVCALDAGDAWAVLGERPTAWSGRATPLGAMAAGALAAGEAFKAAMRKLVGHAPSPKHFESLFAPARPCEVVLAPDGAQLQGHRLDADLISGGAIGNAFLFAALRVPGVEGRLAVLDDDVSELSNLNRNALLRRSGVGTAKVDDLASKAAGGLLIEPRRVRYVAGMPLAPVTLVGVDDIPSRWAAQRSGPDWLGVGATSGFSVQVSSHKPEQACAGCLHPESPPAAGPIPTAAFVSFWAGLLLATRWLRSLAGAGAVDPDQQLFFSPLRPEGWRYAGAGVFSNLHCPVGCRASQEVSAVA